ncbi:MAG: two-component regulator propeller domain-containing protein [Dehalogenimonas sp.]
MRVPTLVATIVLVFILSSIPRGFVQAEEYNNYHFEHINITDGLPPGGVRCILQDQYGFILMGTSSGLVRYDGIDFTSYQTSLLNPNSISGNNVSSIYQSNEGRLWIGTTGGGLNEYIYAEDQFVRYLHEHDNNNTLVDNVIDCICGDSFGNIWIGTDNGLSKFDYKHDIFTNFQHDPSDPRSLSNNIIRSMIEDNTKTLWIGTMGGLNKYENGQFRNINTEYSRSIKSDHIYSLGQSIDGQMFIGTDAGLHVLDQKMGSIRIIPEGPNGLSSGAISDIHIDKNGNAWLATFTGGLNVIDIATGNIKTFRHYQQDPLSLANDSLVCVYEDSMGIIWIGTSLAGVDKLILEKQVFHNYYSQPGLPSSISSDNVTSIFEDKFGCIWVGTDFGLNRVCLVNNKVTQYFYDSNDPNSISNNRIRSIFEDSFGDLWIGTDFGINRYIRNMDNFIQYTKNLSDTSDISKDRIYTITEDTEKSLWVSTDKHLYKYCSSSDIFKPYEWEINVSEIAFDRHIYSMCPDLQGVLWLGTVSGGLYRYDPYKSTLYQIKDISQTNFSLFNGIWSIYRESNGMLWCGTNGSGLFRFNPSTNEVVNFDMNNGFVGNMVYAIVQDANKRIWVSTENGVSCLDTSGNLLLNLDVNSGLLNTCNNPGAAFANKGGGVFFGGINGLSMFNSDQAIFTINNIPKLSDILIIKITEFKTGTILSRYIRSGDSLTYSYGNNSLNFNFVSTNYYSPISTKYAYRLVGFEDDWHYADAYSRSAIYTNLPSNKYTLEIKIMNFEKGWNNQTASFSLVIQSPFWETWWFTGMITLFSLSALFGIYRLRIGLLYRQKVHLEGLVQQRTAEITEALRQRDEMIKQRNEELAKRSEFTRVIVHELKTPLTPILVTSELITNNVSDRKLKKWADNINQAAYNLNKRINELLEIARGEIGLLKIHKQIFDYTTMVKTVASWKAPEIKRNNQKLIVTIDDEIPFICGDEDRLQQVLMNLIENASRYSPKGSKIIVKAFMKENYLLTEVIDNGPGIPSKVQQTLFNAYTPSGFSSSGGLGLGLVFSKMIIEAHKGRIWINSKSGIGSIVGFEILNATGGENSDETLNY